MPTTSAWSCPCAWWTDAVVGPGASQELAGGEEADQGNTGFDLQVLGAAALPVHQREDRQDPGPQMFHGVNGSECRTSTGEGVFDHYDPGILWEPALDLPGDAIALRLLSDGEGVDGASVQPATVGQGVGNGVGSHGEAPHPLGPQVVGLEGSQTHCSHQRLTLCAHGRTAGIDVVGRTGPARQGKLSHDEGPFDEKLQEAAALIHTQELPPEGGAVKARMRPGRPLAFLLPLLLVLGACESDPVDTGDLAFAQVGQIQVQVQSVVAGGVGSLEETLSWRSEGPWVLAERISYDGQIGGETVRRPVLNPGELAPEYSSLIQQLNTTPGLRLFSDESPQQLDPECGSLRSRVTVTLRDEVRGEAARWIRCADGTFFTTTPGSAGPDAGASRVVTAAQLSRFFTLGNDAVSSYLGSLPFRTLAIGEDSPARPGGPRVFRSDDAEPPTGWMEFWNSHAGASEPPPEVDWERDMVVLAAVGRRLEAGDSVQVGRILPIDEGTRVEVVHRVPGDFCSPAAREGYPFHLAVAPRAEAPIQFADPIVERVPCGR